MRESGAEMGCDDVAEEERGAVGGEDIEDR